MLALAESTIQLVPDGTLLFHLALVVVMVLVLNRTLLKPINVVLAERDRRTSGKLGEAAQISDNAKAKMRSWEQGLREARNEAYRLLEKERAEALREREGRLGELKRELSALVEEQKANIKSQEKEAQVALELEGKRLAELIGAQILGRPIRT
jgi:F0F1-type ATP synthase membrane subunit b/b'